MISKQPVIRLEKLSARSPLRCCSLALMSLALAIGMTGNAWSKDDESKKDMSQQATEEMLETREDSPKNGILRQRVAFERDSESILKTFAPAISQAPDSVVEILVDNKRVALGTAITADGEILTKASQIVGSPVVRLASGESVEPKILGVDLKDDLALLKIEGYSLEPIRWESSISPPVGSWVISSHPGKGVGSIGIVSVKSREIPKEPGALGIRMDDEAQGVVVSDFSGDDTPAKRAGVQIGDHITEINNEPLLEIPDLIKAVQAYSPGDVVVLTVERGEATISLEVVLDTLAVIDEAWKHKEMQETLGAELSLFRSGFTQALQHDSALNPNDCGGPLLDLSGNPVGINIARAGRVSSYTLPIEIVKERLVALRSGELAPEAVFASRISRLNAAVERLTGEVDADFNPQLTELDKTLETLKVEKGKAQDSLETAQASLDDVEARISELMTQREVLDKKVQALQEKQQRYQATIDALKRGIRVN